MTVRHGFQATMTARPGKGDAMVEMLLHAPSLARDDCPVFLISRSADDADVVHVTEGWTSSEAHAAFFATAEAQALVVELQSLLAGEPQYTDQVPVGGKAELGSRPAPGDLAR